jgi:zinc transporter
MALPRRAALLHDAHMRRDEVTEFDTGLEDGPLLFGRVLDGEGGAREIRWEAARKWKPASPKEVLWLHLQQNAEGLEDWLKVHLEMSEPTAELLVSDENRPRSLREGNAIVATLRGINYNPGTAPEDMVTMHLWSDGARVVTLRRVPLQTPQHVLTELDAGRGPQDAGKLITELVEVMITRMSRSIVSMNEQIDVLEDPDYDENAEAKLARISAIRRNCLALKRHMSPQHDALEQISSDAPAWFEEHDRREIAESIEHLRRYLDDIDISKESVLVLQDELRAGALARSESVTYKLTMVAGVFLPLSFITGLLGINVGGMPGVDDWRAFWIVVVLCAMILGLMLAMFRKWEWL